MKKTNFVNGLKKIDKRVIVGTLLFLCCILHLSAATYRDVGDNVWKEFREKFPVPFRTIACHEMNDGRRVYIISEPPNNVSLNAVEKIFNGFVHFTWTNSTRIGYDGIMRDIVVYTDGIPDFCHKQIVTDLNQLLYGTTYKASYLSLPYKGKPKSCFYDMDINVTVNDKALYDWFCGGINRFKNVLTGTITTSYELIESKQFGVFAGINNNIVVWCIPSKTDISGSGYLFHIFQIESDLLLGAIYSNDVVMIAGRKRLCDIVSVPPLREDEALMLAAAKEEIYQSLNITTPVYCKIDGIYDWCPAWVSDNIAHSEYAHLLTVTDNYLKFWLSYDNYDLVGYNNCKPGVPFDKKIFDGIRSIRYNWNTKEWVNESNYNNYSHNYSILYFNNIGCLNFNLFNTIADTSLARNERLAYDYFIKCRSADVFRAAQYTMLYEIFRRFDITASKNKYQNTTHNSFLPFLTSAITILTRIKNLTDAEIDNISKEIYKNKIEPLLLNLSEQEKVDFVKDEYYVEDMKSKWEKALVAIAREEAGKLNVSYEQYQESEEYIHLQRKMQEKITQRTLNYFNLYMTDFEKKYRKNTIFQPIEQVRNKLKSITVSQFQNLCKYCASPNTYNGGDIIKIKSFLDTLECQFILSSYSKYFGIQIKDMFDDYVRYYKNDGKKWFKAPSVVVINNNENQNRIDKRFKDESKSCIGGHNISTSIKKQLPSSFPQGQQVLSLSGDPIGDAYYYGQKAVQSTSLDDKIMYIRRSKEAMSQEITSQNVINRYGSLYTKIERSILASNNQRENVHDVINDYNEIIDIAESELSHEENLSPHKKESYEFVLGIAKNTVDGIKKMKGVVNNKQGYGQAEIEHPENRTEKNVESNGLPAEDDEIKALKERLKRLQLTLAELKKQ